MKIFLICRSSCPLVFYKVGVLKNFAKYTRKHQRRSLFYEVVGRRPQAYYFIKKRKSGACGNLQNFEEHLFYRTAVDGCFWMYQNINCQKVSVSELIISKSCRGRKKREKQITPPYTRQLSRLYCSKRVI